MTKFQFDIVYDCYKAEIDTMHKIDAQASFYGVVCSAFGGVISYLFLHAGEVSDPDIRILVVSLAVTSAITLGVGIWWLWCSYVGHRYRLTPSAADLRKYFAQEFVTHANPDVADLESRKSTAGYLADAADFNRTANRLRYSYYTRCSHALLAAFALWILASVGFVLTK